jgi:hypothetical protein
MPSEHDGRTDFDFFIGRWKAHNRRLRERLKGSNDWDELEGAAVTGIVIVAIVILRAQWMRRVRFRGE